MQLSAEFARKVRDQSTLEALCHPYCWQANAILDRMAWEIEYENVVLTEKGE